MDLDVIVRTTAVLLAGAALAAALRTAASSTRHLVWNLTIVFTLLTPFLAPLAPTITVPFVSTVPEAPKIVVLTTMADAIAPAPSRDVSDVTAGTIETIGTLGSAAVGSWFLLCWLLSGLSVWRGSSAAPEVWLNEARDIARRIGLKRPIAVRQLHREASPHVAGLFRSVVMMPPSATEWSFEARQAVLVHELTHIKRHDRLTQAVAQLACALYWFNPLAWYAAAGLARERERACDDEVLKFGARPSVYATLLLDLARATRTAWTPATSLSMARPSAIEGRLLSILADAVRTPRPSTRWIVGAAIITSTTAILGAQAARPSPAPQPAQTPAPAPAPKPLIKPQRVMELDTGGLAPAMVRALIGALGDQDGGVREHAAMGLAITPGSEVIDPLLGALRDPDAQVREKAAIGLAFRRDPRIVDPLLTAMSDSDAQVREKAAIALGASGDARAIAALTKATADPDSQVREKAVAGLVLLGLRQ